MNYGLYLSASGVLTNMYRQDVFANNLANVETIGFKRDLATVAQRDPESIEEPLLRGEYGNRLLDRLGGGVLAGPQHTVFNAAPLRRTDGPLDVALEGGNTFFAVSATDPQTGERQVRLTRDGRFGPSADGYLVTVDGARVLGPNDAPIALDREAPASIDGAGQISQNGEVIGRLQVAAVQETQRLVKQGGNLFAWQGQEDPRQAVASPTVYPGHLETSGVDSIRALMEIVDATKAASSNANLIRYHDLLMDRAVNTLGRIA